MQTKIKKRNHHCYVSKWMKMIKIFIYISKYFLNTTQKSQKIFILQAPKVHFTNLINYSTLKC
jgi:hypothetical protein